MLAASAVARPQNVNIRPVGEVHRDMQDHVWEKRLLYIGVHPPAWCNSISDPSRVPVRA
jgi:hypothetical protein